MHPADLLLELGAVIFTLGVLGRLAGRIGLSPIPLYLLAGLAFGKGGLLPLTTSEGFLSTGADIGAAPSRPEPQTQKCRGERAAVDVVAQGVGHGPRRYRL